MEIQEEPNAGEHKETIQIQEKNLENENKQEEQTQLNTEQFIKNEKEYAENSESNNGQENKIKFGNEIFDFDIQLKLRKVDSDEFMISSLKGEKQKQKQQQQNQEKRRKLRKFSNAVEEIKEREKNKESEENSMNRSQEDLPKYAEKQREKEKKLQKLEISEQDFLLASSQSEYSFQNQFNNQFIQPCIENEIIPDTQIKEEMEDLEEDFDNSDEDSELISKDSLLLDQNNIVIYDSDSDEDQENSSKILKRQDNIQRSNQQEVIVEQEEDFQIQDIEIENQNKEQVQDQNIIQKQENQIYDDQQENQQTDKASNLQGNQEQQKNDGEIVIDNLEQLREYQKNKEIVKESQEILIKNQFSRKLQKSLSSIGSEQLTKQKEQQNQFQGQISSIENEYQSQNNSGISQSIVINNKSKSNSINLNNKNRNQQQNSDQLENSQINSQYKKSGGFYNNNSQNLNLNLNLNLNQKGNKFRKSLTNYTLNLGKILTEGALHNRRRNVSRMKNLDIKGEFKLQYWVELQQKLKQEVNLVEKETEFKDEIMKELKRLNTSYYTNYIELINLEDGVKYDEELKQIDPKQFFQSSSNQSQNLNNNKLNLDRFKKNGHQQIKYVIADEQKVFNFVSMQIQKFLSYLQNNPKVMIFAILNHQTKLSSSQISNLSRAFINTVYDEIIEQNTQKNKLYEFFAQLLKQTVENIEQASDLKLINNSFYGKILRQFLKRYSFKVYLEQVKRVPLWHITRVDSDLRINKIENIYEEGQKLFRTDPKAYKASISSWQKQNKKQQQQQFRQKKYSESLMYDQEAQLQKPQIEKYEDMMKNMQKKDILNMIEKNQEAQIAQMPGKKTLNQIKISDSFLQQQQNQQLQQRSESVTLETLGKILDQQEIGNVSSTYRQSNPVFQSQQLQQQKSQLLMEEKDSVQSSQNTLFQSQNLKKYLSQQQELENRNQQHNQKQQQQQQQQNINNSMVLKKGNYFLQKSNNNNSNFIFNNSGNSSNLQRQKSEIYQDLYVQSQLEKRSKKLEQLVHIVMQSIFDHMHNFPNGIKIVLKMVKMLILKKFQDSDSNCINQIFANYIFDIWILPQLQFPQLYIDLKLIKAVHNVNLMEIRKIIQKIFNKSSFSDENYSRYNVIIEQYMESVDKYYEEISNVNEKLIEEIFQKSELIENQIFEKLQTQTICLSVENIQNLINMVYSCKEELGEKFGENGSKLGILEIIKQLHKQCQDKDLKLFESKKNLDSKNVNRVFLPGEIFVLFQNFRLPSECDTNFQQVLNKSYKVNFKDTKENIAIEKTKNVLRQLLIQMEDVDNFYNYMGQKGKLSFIDIVELYKQQNYVSLSNSTVKSDQIPGHLKAEYFLSLTKKLQAKYRLNDYRLLYEELRENLRERMENFKDITQKIKVMVLRAKQCLQKKLTINQKIMDRFKQEISRRELYFFIEKARFSFCLTNQEMRSKLPINKKLLEQNYEEQLNGQLIIEEQQSCIHSLVNTKFLNSLAGNLQENDPTKNSHFTSIKEFIKIFSELPEVKNLIKNGDDKFKVNENFNEFISALMDLIKEDEQFDQMQSKDLIWLQDNLEQYITKQIYDKLFPKKSTVKDLSLCIRLQTLDWITYDHLEIDEFNREDSMWEKAAQSLNNIENCRTPTEKLEALQECTNNMADILKLTSKKEEAVGADITTPCMIYILLKAKPQKLPSNLYFINAFANSQSMRTASGFCFTQIRSVMGFLENLQASQLKNISQLQFDRNTYERECQLEISFLKKRPREGRRKIRFDLVKKVQSEQLEIISCNRNSINSQNSQQGQSESQYNLNANNDSQNIKIDDKNIDKNENQKEQIQNNQSLQQKKKQSNEQIQEEVNNRNRQKSSALFQRRISQNLNFLNGNLASSEIVSKNQENAKKLLGIEENYNSENEFFSQSQKMQISELIKEKNAQTSNIY